jgi:hypothetical protein
MVLVYLSFDVCSFLKIINFFFKKKNEKNEKKKENKIKSKEAKLPILFWSFVGLLFFERNL